MRRQNTVQRKSQSRRKFLLGDLTGQVVGEEGREDAVAGLEGRYAVADLSDYSARIRAGDDGLILANGFVMGVFAVADCCSQITSLSLLTGQLFAYLLCHGSSATQRGSPRGPRLCRGWGWCLPGGAACRDPSGSSPTF